MSHILSHDKGFAFIHLPKNGGSTIRDQFAALDDCGQKYFYRNGMHDKHGEIAFGHLPLWVIAQDAPDDLEFIAHTWSCAVTRDPSERFRSAMAQRAREFLGKPLPDQTKAERQSLADDIMRHLEARPNLPAAEFVHFTRQVDFIRHEGAQVVKHLYPLSNIDALIAELGQRTGQTTSADRKNQTEYTKNGAFGQIARGLWATVKPILPAAVQSRLRQNLRGMVVQSGNTDDRLGLMNDRLTAFVRDFYADDFDIHNAALARSAAGHPSQPNMLIA